MSAFDLALGYGVKPHVDQRQLHTIDAGRDNCPLLTTDVTPRLKSGFRGFLCRLGAPPARRKRPADAGRTERTKCTEGFMQSGLLAVLVPLQVIPRSGKKCPLLENIASASNTSPFIPKLGILRLKLAALKPTASAAFRLTEILKNCSELFYYGQGA